MDNKFPYEVTFGLSEHLWWCSYKQLLHYQDYFYFTQDTHDLSGLQISIQYSFIIAAIKGSYLWFQGSKPIVIILRYHARSENRWDWFSHFFNSAAVCEFARIYRVVITTILMMFGSIETEQIPLLLSKTVE